MSDAEEIEDQPNGEYIETALEVISHILSDPEFSAEVVRHNGWKDDLDQKDVAILFLASRFQAAITGLSLRTDTVKRELDGIARIGS